MSRYIFLLFIGYHPLMAQENCFSKKDYKEYYYLNGIKNTTQESLLSSKSIKRIFQLKDILPIYNKSQSFLEDVKETFFLKNIENKRLSKEKTIQELKTKPETYQDVNKYLSQLDDKKQNYVFAHSEGNLFANFMCELKDKDLKLDVISFGTPSDYLKCNLNKKFALFEEDTVIFAGNFNLPFLKKVKPNYKANISIIYKEPETNEYGLNLMSHSLSLYLMHEKVVSDLKQKLEKTESEIYEKDYSFHLATIEIKEDGEFKKFFNNLEDAKDSVFLWGREKQAFLNIVSYSTELAANLNKKGFIKKIIETPIPAEDEQAFADMIAYSLNSLNSYCKSVFPPRLQPLCSKVGVRDYFKSKELREPELSYLGFKDYKFMIPCSLASESVNKTMPISLSYEKREPTVLFNGNEVNIDFEGDESLVFNKPIGEIKISKNEDESVITEFHESSTKPKVKKEESQDRMTQCNTLAKLGSKNCQDFLKHLEKKYFSAKK